MSYDFAHVHAVIDAAVEKPIDDPLWDRVTDEDVFHWFRDGEGANTKYPQKLLMVGTVAAARLYES
jgi:hypothetical protein